MTAASKRLANLTPEKRALLAKKLRATHGSDDLAATAGEPIAVIGTGCRLPGGCQSPEAFWELLRNGVDAITEIPPDRWDVDAVYDPRPGTPGKTFVRWGGFLDDIDQFDASFFGISPREATWMDPQQRILLEVTWSAFERAGQVRERLAGSQTGVFIGVCNSDYATLDTQDTTLLEGYMLTGVAHSIVANRLSYVFDLRGPSVVVDTACSSSLVAVHLACQSLRLGECDMALAGGVNLLLLPEGIIAFSQWNSLAADGRCKTFDARADGFVRSEGCAVIVLKRLSDALNQGDPILGLIRGSAVNQDGLSTGLTAPNVLAQQTVLQQALKKAGATSDQIDYIEAHGTGTSLGDPIEIEALSEVYGRAQANGPACVIGSVKTNIGHTEASAGVVGLLKILLAFEHEAIPPHLHFRKLNPNITLENTQLVIPTELRAWPISERRRLAAISAFGFGGTNAHMILEEAPQSSVAETISPDQPHMLVLSAANDRALRELAHRYTDYLDAATLPALQDICSTASRRRTHHDHRLALVGQTPGELRTDLQAFLRNERNERVATGVKTREKSRIVFVFPGQGSQWPGMGRQLFAQEPVFRTAIEACAQALQPHLDWSLLDLFATDAPARELERIDCIQPAIFAIQVALAALWRQWGIQPDAVIGHSMGEIAATCVAGALSLEDAARVIARRSRLLRRVSGHGAMAVVALSLDQAQEALAAFADRVSVAVSNSPQSTVLSGDPTALQEILHRLTAQNIFCRMIKVDVASHSPQMDPLRADLLADLAGLAPRAGRVPIYSTVQAQMIDGQGCDSTYWVRNLREPVLFAAGIQGLLEHRHDLFIELSPHPILLTAIEQMIQQHEQEAVALASLRREEDERAALFKTLRTIYTIGQPIAWNEIYPSGQCVALPAYPWQRERFWINDLITAKGGPPTRMADQRQHVGGHPLLGLHLASSVDPAMHFWETAISLEGLHYLADYQVHALQEMILLPTAAYIEMLLAATADMAGTPNLIIEQLDVSRALLLTAGHVRSVQVVVQQETPHTATAHISSRPAGAAAAAPKWTRHANATLRFAAPETAPAPPVAATLEAIQARCTLVQTGEQVYQSFQQRGLAYGPAFRGIAQLWQQHGEALARLELPNALLTSTAAYRVHPAYLDAALQTLAVLHSDDATRQPGALVVPTRIEHVQVYQPPQHGVWSHAVLRPTPPDQATDRVGDVTLLDEAGQVVIDIRGIHLQTLADIQAADLDRLLYHLRWQAAPRGVYARNGDQLPDERMGCWIIFADRQGMGAHLQQKLQERGARSVLVIAAELFEARAGDDYRINPDEPADYTRLLAAVCGSPGECRGIIHLWSLETPAFADTTSAVLDAARNRPCESALHLLQAIVNTEWAAAPRLWLMTQGAQVVDATDAAHLAVAQAPLWGLGRVMALEHPEYWGGLIDLAPTAAEHVAQVLDSICHPDDEDQVAFRNETRYVLRLQPDHLPETAQPVVLDPAASYLITGGLGGLGLKVAHSLVEQGARYLFLTGRSAFPERVQWDDLPADSPLNPQVHAIRALEAAGAVVQVLQADVSDLARISAVFAEIQAAHPPLRGIIHAAGVGQPRMLHESTPDELRAVFQAKVQGSWILHQLAHDLDLDFMVYFSSGAAVWGSLGMGAYAAANSFMDMLAHARRAHNLPALSINWGRWAELRLVGSATDDAERLFTQIGMEVIPTDQALMLLHRLIGVDTAQISVAAITWRTFKAVYEAKRRRMLFADIAVPAQSTGDPAAAVDQVLLNQLQQARPKERLRLLTTHIQKMVGQVLRLDAGRTVAPQQGFFQMGMDSVMSVELKQRLEQSLGCTLPSTLAFEYPTVEDVARYLATEVLVLDIAVAETAERTQAETKHAALRTEIATLSDEDAEALLADELKHLTKRK